MFNVYITVLYYPGNKRGGVWMELGELESSLLSFLSCAKAKRVLHPIEKMDGEQNWFYIWSVFHVWEEAGLELGNRLYRVFF